MTIRTRLLPAAALFAAGIALGPAVARPPAVGQAAPPFTLTTIDGTKITSDHLRGQVVILNYWATWCAPCRQELPLLDAYYALQQRHGLRVFAALHITPVRRMTGPYRDITGLPTNYVIDRAGRVRYAQAGAFTLDDLNRVIVPLLNEPAPAPAAPAA